MLVVAAFLFIVSSAGTGAAGGFMLFIVWRMLGGFAIGLASNVSPLYIAEVAPAELRGRLVSLNQLTIVLGILLAQIVNWQVADPVPDNATAEVIRESWNGQYGWRWMFWITNIPAMLFFAGAFFVPESPRWLSMHGRTDQARQVLTRIGSAEYADQELKNIAAATETETVARKGGLRRLLHPSMRRVLVIGVVLAVFQQWCGINVIFNYAQEIFAAAGYGISDTLMNIVVTGVTNVIFTFVAIFTIDRLGRRALLLFGAGGLAVIYLLLGGAYYLGLNGVALLVIVVLAIACYAMSLAPVMWVVISEIYPNSVRSAAMSVATFALWFASFVLTYTFPLLNRALGAAGTFWSYGVICLLGWLFVRRSLPETKNKSLEAIEKELIK